MTGLTSISFREHSPEQIIAMTKKAGLDGIEWGGDVHVPPGEIALATEIARLTREAGLKVLSYGSYCCLGEKETLEDFEKVLTSAKALGAPMIRIWAGRSNLNEAPQGYVRLCAEQWGQMCDTAGEIQVHTEYHRNSLTETVDGAETLLALTAGKKNRGTYWQPNPDLGSHQERLQEIERLQQEISYVHVFYWPDNQRRPLAEGIDDWRDYIAEIRKGTQREHAFILEFVMHDTEEQFYKDAELLNSIVL